MLAQPLPTQLIYQTRSAPTNPTLDLTTMVFISNIPPSITDYALEQILWACGPVRSFKRVYSYKQNHPKRVGFCTFDSAIGMLRALRVLGGEGSQESPVLRGGIKLSKNEFSALKITCDPIARFSLKAVRDTDAVNSDLAVYKKIGVLVSQLKIDDNDYSINARKILKSSQPTSPVTSKSAVNALGIKLF